MIKLRNINLEKFSNSVIRKFSNSRRGFTLIESLAVIAIIGILLSLGTYIFTQAQAQARDAVRKSDLNQVAQAFNARALDKTCTDQSAVGLYPGESLEQTNSQIWLKVSQLATYSDGCGPFISYLPTIPNDVRSPAFSYYFNLSTIEKSGSQTVTALAKHYRLTTALEHQFSVGSPDQLECVRLSHVWISSFGGQPYDCDQHVITVLPVKFQLIPTAHAQVGNGIPCSTDVNGNPIPNVPPGCIIGGGGGGTGGGGGGGGTGGGGGGGTGGGTTPGPYNYYLGQ